mmetsp:Transcript_2745/g.3986  ORF Transcript_2745/g.3986 Transcript_2745/m.3986 type:complete len:125 (+) Transcript_2745:316-690(+)
MEDKQNGRSKNIDWNLRGEELLIAELTKYKDDKFYQTMISKVKFLSKQKKRSKLKYAPDKRSKWCKHLLRLEYCPYEKNTCLAGFHILLSHLLFSIPILFFTCSKSLLFDLLIHYISTKISRAL